MLTVSLHSIRIHAFHGLYPEELVLGNDFETDVDIFIPISATEQWPFVDYTLINTVVNEVFAEPAKLLETLALRIHEKLKRKVPEADKIKVTIRKMSPPMPGDIKYAQVSFED